MERQEQIAQAERLIGYLQNRTTAMADAVQGGIDAATGARSVVLGALANMIVKLGIAVGVGQKDFRRASALELGALTLANAAGLALLWVVV